MSPAVRIYRKDEKMQMDIEMNEEGSRERKRLLAACRFLLWALMIGVSIYLASRSLMV